VNGAIDGEPVPQGLLAMTEGPLGRDADLVHARLPRCRLDAIDESVELALELVEGVSRSGLITMKR